MTRIEPDYDLKINDVSIKADNVVEKLSVSLPVNSQASSFTVKLENGAGTFNDFFAYHDDVKIYLGYVSEGVVGTFHGRVEKVKKGYNKSAGATVTISGRGTWVLLMENFTINSYTNTDLGNIIIAEVNARVPSINTGGVVTAGIVPGTEFLDHVFLNQLIANYCVKAQYFSWVNFDDVLHFTGSPGANEVSIDSGDGGNVEDISLGIDWKTVRNYIRTYGKMVEEVQLFKTEQDEDSIAKYGKVMKIIKNAGMDTASLVQSISDAALLEDKESEWGGLAVIYGDERVVPGKTITLNVSEIGESGTSYRVRHVNHSYEPKSSGFKTTVMLVQDEQDTSAFYKELYEKTKDSIEFANSGNYEESYVYKFTKDQDDFWTFTNTYTTDSSLQIGNPSSSATAEITDSIVGDANYTKCLPFVREEYSGNDGNKYYVSNDKGATWEELDPYGAEDDAAIEHTFASSTGDKNDLKFKVTMDEFDALVFATKKAEIVVYRPWTFVEVWFGDYLTFKEYWRFGTPWGGNAYGVTFYKDGNVFYTTNSDSEIYTMDSITGSASELVATLGIDIRDCAHDGTNLWVVDATNGRISQRNASDLTVEDSNFSLPAGAGTALWGLAYDGANFVVGVKPDGSSSAINSIWVYCSATQRLPDELYYGGSGTYAKTGAGYCSAISRFFAVRDGTRFLMQFNADLISISAALNMETVCGASGYDPQSCCGDGTTLWSTNTDGTTNRIAKHVAGDYGIAAAATYDFSVSTYGTFVGICFDGSDLWILSDLGTYGTWYKIDDADGSLDETHTITGTESTGNLWADCEWDGSNLYATYTTKGETNRDKVLYKFNATPTTISTEIQMGWFPEGQLSYDGPIGRGLAWDGTNFHLTWHYPSAITNGCWYKLANASSYGALAEAWYPFGCATDGTYIWFIENTSFTTVIRKDTGAREESLSTLTYGYALDYAENIASSKVYTLGAYLKLDY